VYVCGGAGLSYPLRLCGVAWEHCAVHRVEVWEGKSGGPAESEGSEGSEGVGMILELTTVLLPEWDCSTLIETTLCTHIVSDRQIVRHVQLGYLSKTKEANGCDGISENKT